MPDEENRELPRRKRIRTNGTFACEACRARRSKCDLVDHLGCHRCKQLRTPCSLQADAAQMNVQPAPFTSASTAAVPPVQDPSSSIAVLLARFDQLEKGLAAIRGSHTPIQGPFDYSLTPAQNGVSPLSSFAGPYVVSPNMHRLAPPQTAPTHRQPRRSSTRIEQDRDESWFRRTADPETFSRIDRGIHDKEERGLRDPVLEGVITRRRAEDAFLLFKHHFSTVHPLLSILGNCRSLPDHPFLLSASLYYATRCLGDLSVFTPNQVARLEDLVHANIIAYIQGCRPSIEGILSAFILSMLPIGSATVQHNTPDVDAFRMIGMAYGQVREFGQTVFIARLVRLLGTDVSMSQLEQPLNDARCFMSVINRSAWFTLSRAHGASPPSLIDDNQRALLSFLQLKQPLCEVDRYLMLEHGCLDILLRHVRSWQALQMNVIVDPMDLVQGNELTRSACDELDALKNGLIFEKEMDSLAYMRCHILYCRWWTAVRNIWAIYHLPYPSFVDDINSAWLAAIWMAAEASMQMLQTCLEDEWRLNSFPKAIGNAIALCHSTLSTGALWARIVLPAIPLPPFLAKFYQTSTSIEAVLAHGGHELSSTLARTKAKLDDYQIQLERQMNGESGVIPTAMQGEGIFSGFGLPVDPTSIFPDYHSFLSGMDSSSDWWGSLPLS